METEIILMQIVQDVVGVKSLNRDSRFLDIGGNSLNLVEVLRQIKGKFGVIPSPRVFFDKKLSTIAYISSEIDGQVRENEKAAQTVS